MSYLDDQPQDFFRTTTGSNLPDGVTDTTESILRTGMVFAKGFKAESGLPVGGNGQSEQFGFYFSGTEGDGGMHAFPGSDGVIGFATDSIDRVILRTGSSGGAWTLNAGTLAQAQAINAYHYINGTGPGGATIAARIDVASGGSAVAQPDAVNLLFKNNNTTNSSGPVGIIGASDLANPTSALDLGAHVLFWRAASSVNNQLGFGVNTRSATGSARRLNIYPTGLAAFDCDATLTGLIWQTARGNVPALAISHNGAAFSIVGAVPYTVVSDRKYKDAIAPVPRAVVAKAIAGLNASTWTWNAKAMSERGASGGGFGFIAQDVQIFAPEAVTELLDGTLAVAESKLIPYLWTQIQMLTEQVALLTKAAPATTVTTTPVTTTTTTTLSVNMAKVDRLLKMDSVGLGAIGFTTTQTATFTAGSAALRAGVTSGLPEAEVLKVLSTLLTSIGLTLAGVMAKL